MVTSIKRLYVVIPVVLYGALFSMQTPPRRIQVEQPNAPKRRRATGIRLVGSDARKKLQFKDEPQGAVLEETGHICVQSIFPIERAVALLSPEQQIICRNNASIAYIVNKISAGYGYLSVEQLKLLLMGIIHRLC